MDRKARRGNGIVEKKKTGVHPAPHHWNKANRGCGRRHDIALNNGRKRREEKKRRSQKDMGADELMATGGGIREIENGHKRTHQLGIWKKI